MYCDITGDVDKKINVDLLAIGPRSEANGNLYKNTEWNVILFICFQDKWDKREYRLKGFGAGWLSTKIKYRFKYMEKIDNLEWLKCDPLYEI